MNPVDFLSWLSESGIDSENMTLNPPVGRYDSIPDWLDAPGNMQRINQLYCVRDSGTGEYYQSSKHPRPGSWAHPSAPVAFTPWVGHKDNAEELAASYAGQAEVIPAAQVLPLIRKNIRKV